MIKSATIYERNGIYFICTSSRTTSGLWISDGDCYMVNVDSEYEELGKYVFMALNNSRYNIPDPTDWKVITIPLLKAAKVKSFSAFGKIAKCVLVDLDNKIEITSTENKSNIKRGFVDKEEKIILPVNTSNTELGKSIEEAFLKCL